MATVLPMHRPQSDDGRRWAAGVLVSARCRRVSAALVGVAGQGLEARFHLAGSVEIDVPAETVSRFLLTGSAACPAGTLAVLRAELAEIQAAALQHLFASLSVNPSLALAVGVHDPGFWNLNRAGPGGYLSLCDAARLAETTGLNVIDAFPARDLAQRGQGGPVTALAQWALAKDPQQSRVLVDLGQTVRMTYLPANAERNAARRVLSFDVGPGMGLLDQLTQRLTAGEHRFDPGGRMAVQGRRISELIDHWLSDPYFDRPLPRWHPWGVRPERFLTDALEMAVKSRWSVRDLLCSATHFIAETVSQVLRRRLPDDAPIDQILITGGGQQNGMLLAEIDRRVGMPLTRIGEIDISSKAFYPACIAVLALLHLDQVPANATAITQVDIPRILGRLTPGSPQNWQRLLASSAGNSLTLRPLRSAL